MSISNTVDEFKQHYLDLTKNIDNYNRKIRKEETVRLKLLMDFYNSFSSSKEATVADIKNLCFRDLELPRDIYVKFLELERSLYLASGDISDLLHNKNLIKFEKEGVSLEDILKLDIDFTKRSYLFEIPFILGSFLKKYKISYDDFVDLCVRYNVGEEGFNFLCPCCKSKLGSIKLNDLESMLKPWYNCFECGEDIVLEDKDDYIKNKGSFRILFLP